MTLRPCGADKGRPTYIRVVSLGNKGLHYECCRCGQRWPLKEGDGHP